MLDKRVKDSISFRFLALILATLIVLASLVSVMIGINERRTLKGTLSSKGLSLASYVAKLSQDPLIMKDYLQLDAIVNEANNDKDVIYTMIQDSQGKTLTSQYASVDYRSPRVRRLLSDLPKNSELPDLIAAIGNKEPV